MPKRNAQGSKKPLPVFAAEDDERVFWDTHDTTEYVRWDEAKWTLFPDLKPSIASSWQPGL